MPTRTAYQAAADRLDAEYAAFIRDGEHTGDAVVAAYDYREDGFQIAEAAMRQAPRDRDLFIENECDDHDESARDLISAAAAFRLEELAREAQPMREAA